MNSLLPFSSQSRSNLRSILARYHFGITLLAVALAWLAILLASTTALKSYAHQNLDMAAQLATYSVEPGLMFDDPAAVEEAVQPLILRDGIARILVLNSKGETLLDAQSRSIDPAPFMTRIFLPDGVQARVNLNGQHIGVIEVWGDSSALLRFSQLGLLTGLACLTLTVVGSMALAHRLDRDLIKPLKDIAEVAHDVRLHRRFEKRVEPVGVAELDRLGGDINALLEELHGWQTNIENERALLTHRALHDPLTALPNRAAFDEHFRKRLAAAKTTDSQFALIFIDADNFKQANDQYGHAVGDAVLVELSRRISDALRENDFAARLGGDEFVILLDNVGDEFPADKFVARLRTSVGRAIPLAGQGLYEMVISVGIAFHPQDGATASELLTVADAAMYADKFSHKV